MVVYSWSREGGKIILPSLGMLSQMRRTEYSQSAGVDQRAAFLMHIVPF